MKSLKGFFFLLIMTIDFVDPIGASTEESFLRKMKAGADSFRLQKSLLEVATPLSELGKDIVDQIHRRMDNDEDGDDGDDYILENTYGFQDYSLKYATCQKIQRFSTEAVDNGEYSAMIVDDIVVLRMCPKRYCSSNSQWGCNNGYGEYAIKLDEYLKIMLRYKTDKRSNLCSFCQACGNRRKMEDAQVQQENAYGSGNADDFYSYGGDDDGQVDYNDDGQVDYNDDVNQAGDDGDNNDAGNTNGNDYYNNANLCEKYTSQCENVYNKCNNNDNNDDGMSYLDYIDYMGCVGIQNQNENNYYWLSPHCDSSTNKISMGIFSDPYCSLYVGDSVNINNYAGVNFDNNIFQEFYKNDCIDCSVGYSGPYYNSNNYMCNNIFQRSGQCNTYLAYSVDDGNDQSTSEANCAFIESIRYGTYDRNGQLYISGYSSDKGSYEQTVTPFQTGSLVLLSTICCFLAVYSCVLHHDITNTLLKSFNIGLISPNKMKPRSKGSMRRRRSRSRRELSESDTEYQDDNRAGEMI